MPPAVAVALTGTDAAWTAVSSPVAATCLVRAAPSFETHAMHCWARTLFGLLARVPRVRWSNCTLLALQVQMRAGLDLPTPSSSLPASVLDALPTASPPPATVGGKLGLRIFNTAAGAPIPVCRLAEQAGVGAAYYLVCLPCA